VEHISGWSVDSRSIGEKDLFFALRGPRHDGHQHVADAFSKGAAAAVVERDRDVSCDGTLIEVSDTGEALIELARWARRHWGGTVIAITGSAGKTTTKDLIAHVLSASMPAGKSLGNFNNHVGLPLSILRLPDDARVAVLELAMNHAGEIRTLAGIARPEIGVVTNVGYAHAGNFDSPEDVAAAKRELIESLPSDGTAVLNADDERVARFRDAHPGPAVTFGFSEDADVRAVEMETSETGARFRLASGEWLETKLDGAHGVRNVLAAIAVARLFDIRPEEVAERLRSFEPPPMRGRRFLHGGITIIDDCYNSNPEAVRAMLELLGKTPGKRRIAVLGEMLELGRWAEKLHGDAGRSVVACGINVLVGIRGAARHSVGAAVEAGLPAGAAYFFDEPDEAGDQLKILVREGDVVLFKGSRGTGVDLALRRFLE
jgi:UDP-N-acetylmuramoyl-tripeptide--D-alanyl-D-alanine ligase